MLAAGMTQVATAEALGVSDRTIRNWAKGKAFQGALARAQTRAERQGARAERRAARRRAAIEQQNAAGRPELAASRIPTGSPIRPGAEAPHAQTRANTPGGSTSANPASRSPAPTCTVILTA